MANSADVFRIGLAVRREKICFSLNSSFTLNPDNESSKSTLEPGEYTATISQSGKRPLWSSKIATFPSNAQAQQSVNNFMRYGLNPEIHVLGESHEWGGKQLDARVYAVTLGGGYDPDSCNTGVTLELERIAGPLGLIKYDDQLISTEAIRVSQPSGGEIELKNENGDSWHFASPLRISPETADARFEISDVRVGIDFHWDHSESLTFKGILDLVADGDNLTAVNEISFDDYLASLLGSEMKEDWHRDALAAQAVAARSTILATKGRHHYGEAFDLCHDDHCQCYQGEQRESNLAREALEMTEGAILEYAGKVVDARYSKSCGGLTEHYATAWEDWDLPYLTTVICGKKGENNDNQSNSLNWSSNQKFRQVLKDTPDFVACSPSNNPYPQSSKAMEKLFRWNVDISRKELADLIELRTGRSLGKITKLEVLERGPSGRIRFLRIVGKDGKVTIGKELKIRRLFSKSHLPSSAFVMGQSPDGKIRLVGLGWGHGVGMCQLGAAALAADGWEWEKLLAHYYQGSHLLK